MNLIIQKLRKSPSTFEEILGYLIHHSGVSGEDYNISLRTFQRDLQYIRQSYKIDIEYNAKDNTYAIVSDEREDRQNRMLEAFDTLQALQLSDRLSRFIFFDPRQPKGTEKLYEIIQAIEEAKEVVFSYQKPIDAFPLEKNCHPYALKEFKNRWYLIALDQKDQQVKTFSLERLTDLRVLKKKFVFPQNKDWEASFQHCFGIMKAKEEQPTKVLLSFHPFQGNYIKAMPLHSSQRILVDDETQLKVELKVYLTEDFIMELLSYGDRVEVLEPLALRKELKSRLGNALAKY